MSKRLQVRIGRRDGSKRPDGHPQAKLRAIRKSAEYSFPTAEIGQMLDEIEQGIGMSPLTAGKRSPRPSG